MKKHLALTALVVLPLLAGCGGSSSPATQPSGVPAPPDAPVTAVPLSEAAKPAEPGVGEPFTADMGNGNVAKITIVSAKFVDSVSSAPDAPEPKEGTFLQLDIRWETEKGSTISNPMYFGARDAEGRRVPMALFGDGLLVSGEVTAGGTARGFVNFDAAPGPVLVSVTGPDLATVAVVTVTP